LTRIRHLVLRLLTSIRGRRAETDLTREVAAHLQLLEDDFVSRGMSRDEARYAARRAFGGVEQAKEAQRDARSFRSLSNWAIDLKLGVRMLLKYPILSLVAVIGMALAIAIGAGYFTVFSVFLDSKLPFTEGGRVVSIRQRSDRNAILQVSLEDFLHWRGQLTKIRELSAFSLQRRNLIIPGTRAELVDVAAMSASGFQLTRVAPLLGRPLLEEDERPGASPVVVIGYEEWQRRFGADPQVLGRIVRLDATAHTIVGVMPQGFGFPISHQFWVPLHLTAVENAPDALHVFGRLADGSSLAEARAEVTAIGNQIPAVRSRTQVKLRPEVLEYPSAYFGLPTQSPEMQLVTRAVQFGIGLLLLVVAANVSILVYARTATRVGEIALRSALGATRGRIVTQLFLEALVLSGASAALGLAVAHVGMGMLRDYLVTSVDDRPPFWVQMHLTAGAVFYAAMLALLAAVIVGVIPALKATGKRVNRGLQQFSTRGGAMRLGRTWTTLIVLQVALAVALLPAAIHTAQRVVDGAARQPAPVANQLLRGMVSFSRDGATLAEPAALVQPMTALLERLQHHPEVSAVTFAQSFPGREDYPLIQVEGRGGDSDSLRLRTNRVAPNFFAVLEVPLLAGRGFAAGDERPDAPAVIVDQAFADRLGAGTVVGRRVRYSSVGGNDTQLSGWYEIVGVVPSFADTLDAGEGFSAPVPRLFHAAAPGDQNPAALVVRVHGTAPMRLAPKLIDIAAGVDPRLRLEQMDGVGEAWRHEQYASRLLAIAVIAVVASVLLLSGAGIYAMMAFTVASRRREIGIRSALGANSRHVLVGVFRRAGAQLGAGVVAGITFAAALDRATAGDFMGGKALIILPSVVALICTVGLFAALGPARRSLAVQPAEALRDE